MPKTTEKKEYSEVRENGKKALATVIKQNVNIEIVEKNIHKIAKKNLKKKIILKTTYFFCIRQSVIL